MLISWASSPSFYQSKGATSTAASFCIFPSRRIPRQPVKRAQANEKKFSFSRFGFITFTVTLAIWSSFVWETKQRMMMERRKFTRAKSLVRALAITLDSSGNYGRVLMNLRCENSVKIKRRRLWVFTFSKHSRMKSEISTARLLVVDAEGEKAKHK